MPRVSFIFRGKNIREKDRNIKGDMVDKATDTTEGVLSVEEIKAIIASYNPDPTKQSLSWIQVATQGKNVKKAPFENLPTDIEGTDLRVTSTKSLAGVEYFRVQNKITNTTKSDAWYINTTIDDTGEIVPTTMREFN